MTPVFIILAGSTACIARFVFSESFSDGFPFGTLILNLLTSLAAGYFSVIEVSNQAVITIGVLAALSTWSALANEIASYLRQRQPKAAAVYLFFSVTAGISFAWIGIQLGNAFS